MMGLGTEDYFPFRCRSTRQHGSCPVRESFVNPPTRPLTYLLLSFLTSLLTYLYHDEEGPRLKNGELSRLQGRDERS